MARRSSPAPEGIGRKIQRKRQAEKLTLATLAGRFGMSKQNLSAIERGVTNEFKGSTSVAIAQYLGVPVAEVVSERTPRRKRGMNTSIEYGPAIQRHLPLITWKQAGVWVVNRDGISPKDIETSYPCPVACSPESYVLRVRGPGMEPKFRSGELIFVDPKAEISDGRYVIAMIEGSEDPIFKQIVYEGSRRFLRSVNASYPEPIIELGTTVKILGVVVFRGEPV
jgi:SOS-response transcriptional repressor LexA